MSKQYIPLSARRNLEATESYVSLFPGVPSHLVSSLKAWMEAFFHVGSDWSNEQTKDRLRAIERAMHMTIKDGGSLGSTVQHFLTELADDGSRFLDVIDFVLATEVASPDPARILGNILEQGGSVWRVGFDREANRPELQERVDETMQAVVAVATSVAGNPSIHLSRAWSEAFGRAPNAASAYDEAVKALEAAFQPIVSPKNPKATLGTILKEIESKPEKFATRLDGKAGAPDGVLAVRGSLNVIWQTAVRHGSSVPAAPTSVSIEQARDAVVSAASLVQLVRQGGFKLA